MTKKKYSPFLDKSIKNCKRKLILKQSGEDDFWNEDTCHSEFAVALHLESSLLHCEALFVLFGLLYDFIGFPS